MSIFNHFAHLNLTEGQKTALTGLEEFLKGTTPIFMLKGYAGSGKTTILKGLADYLSSIEKDFVLMAPTGRAAKVIRERTGQAAYTIHKSIYSYDELVDEDDGDSFCYLYKIRNNADVVRKIFIVDEASMLSDAKSEGEFFKFGTGHLLTDLISYTRVCEQTVRTKIIFVGDPCQLAPVGDNSSKAFDAQYLYDKFQLASESAEMKEVRRQRGESGILNAAGKIRKSISAGFFNDFDLRENGKDIFQPAYESFLTTWENTQGTKIIIASKNKTCYRMNKEIRKRRFGNSDLPMQKGEIVIMGGNNYKKEVFNGEFAVVSEVDGITEQRTIALKGKTPVTLTWRRVELTFPDAESSNKIVVGKMLENFLHGDNLLTPEETQALYVDFLKRHSDLKPKTEEFKEAIKNDEYFNCLKMKYGYAVTCHKAQGGEWKNVFAIWDHDNDKNFNCFVDPQHSSGKTNESFYRWTYTAVTRASGNLHAINPPYFNSYSSMAFVDSVVADALSELTGQRIEAEEIPLDAELMEQLKLFNLLEQPVPIQDHFIKVRHTVRKQYLEVTGWEKKGYEIRYSFSRETNKAAFKTYVNGKNEFRSGISVIPNLSPDNPFNQSLTQLLSNLSNVSVTRNTAETITSRVMFDLETEEKFPFTRHLYDDLSLLFEGSKIVIEDLEHLLYKERYIFKRGDETAVIDFEYNSRGFFGRVLPIPGRTNSGALVRDIKTCLQTLKQTEYAS